MPMPSLSVSAAQLTRPRALAPVGGPKPKIDVEPHRPCSAARHVVQVEGGIGLPRHWTRPRGGNYGASWASPRARVPDKHPTSPEKLSGCDNEFWPISADEF